MRISQTTLRRRADRSLGSIACHPPYADCGETVHKGFEERRAAVPGALAGSREQRRTPLRRAYDVTLHAGSDHKRSRILTP